MLTQQKPSPPIARSHTAPRATPKTLVKNRASKAAAPQVSEAPPLVRGPVSTVIYQAIVDLTNSNRIVSRQVLVDITGLTYGVIDDHVKRMIEGGRLRRVANGIFEPVLEASEDRAVSITHLPGGLCKLEIGDVCVDLTLREARMVGMATGGVALQFGR